MCADQHNDQKFQSNHSVNQDVQYTTLLLLCCSCCCSLIFSIRNTNKHARMCEDFAYSLSYVLAPCVSGVRSATSHTLAFARECAPAWLLPSPLCHTYICFSERIEESYRIVSSLVDQCLSPPLHIMFFTSTHHVVHCGLMMRNSDQIKQKLELQDASSFYSHSFQTHTHRE